MGSATSAIHSAPTLRHATGPSRCRRRKRSAPRVGPERRPKSSRPNLSSGAEGLRRSRLVRERDGLRFPSVEQPVTGASRISSEVRGELGLLGMLGPTIALRHVDPVVMLGSRCESSHALKSSTATKTPPSTNGFVAHEARTAGRSPASIG